MKVVPLYVTLDASGNGSVTLRAHKAAIAFDVVKVTVEMAVTSSGKAALFKNGTFVTAMPVNRTMEAYGTERLYTSEYMTGTIENGPSNELVKFTFYYEERETTP